MSFCEYQGWPCFQQAFLSRNIARFPSHSIGPRIEQIRPQTLIPSSTWIWNRLLGFGQVYHGFRTSHMSWDFHWFSIRIGEETMGIFNTWHGIRMAISTDFFMMLGFQSSFRQDDSPVNVNPEVPELSLWKITMFQGGFTVWQTYIAMENLYVHREINSKWAMFDGKLLTLQPRWIPCAAATSFDHFCARQSAISGVI